MRIRLSNYKKYCLENYLNNFSINYINKKINVNNYFIKNSEIILEIGFGNGEYIINSAQNNPNINFLGIDIYLPGISNLLNTIYKKSIKNIKIINYNAKSVIINMIKKNVFSEIRIFFPDPWIKKKQKKRRLLTITFIKYLLNTIIKLGKLIIVTDSEDYIKNIEYDLIYLNKIYINFFNYNINKYNNMLLNTKFERKAILLNKDIFYLFINKIY